MSKMKALEDILGKYESLAVAFSGGTDSAFLLATAKSIWNDPARLLAVTVASPLQPEKDLAVAEKFVRERQIRHIRVDSDAMMGETFLKNPPDRCYFCKKMIFQLILETARAAGIHTVAHGENADDLESLRPGRRAAEEMGIIAPLAEAGLCKRDIRKLSRKMGLETWDKPSSGCLATRIPHGSPITLEKLAMVASAENLLADLGFSLCRVRHHGDLARIEVPEDRLFDFFSPSNRRYVADGFRKIGFRNVSVDLNGLSPEHFF